MEQPFYLLYYPMLLHSNNKEKFNKEYNRFIKINNEVGTVANMARKYGVDYWNLLHYSKGGQNCKYLHLKIEVVSSGEIQEYRKNQSNRES